MEQVATTGVAICRTCLIDVMWVWGSIIPGNRLMDMESLSDGVATNPLCPFVLPMFLVINPLYLTVLFLFANCSDLHVPRPIHQNSCGLNDPLVFRTAQGGSWVKKPSVCWSIFLGRFTATENKVLHVLLITVLKHFWQHYLVTTQISREIMFWLLG